MPGPPPPHTPKLFFPSGARVYPAFQRLCPLFQSLLSHASACPALSTFKPCPESVLFSPSPQRTSLSKRVSPVTRMLPCHSSIPVLYSPPRSQVTSSKLTLNSVPSLLCALELPFAGAQMLHRSRQHTKPHGPRLCPSLTFPPTNPHLLRVSQGCSALSSWNLQLAALLGASANSCPVFLPTSPPCHPGILLNTALPELPT